MNDVSDFAFNTDFYMPDKPQPKIKKTVYPKSPIKDFSRWMAYIRKQILKAAA